MVKYDVGDFIFFEDEVITYYYQVIEGKVKLNNIY